MGAPSHRQAGGEPLAMPALEPGDFARLATFIERTFGIRMPLAKKALLESRLGRRVRDLGLPGFKAYCDHVLDGHPEELVHFIDRVTTNKTDFFREPEHFEVLVERALPALMGSRAGAGHGELHLWSAGCATGEEPYTLAMVLAEALACHPGLDFRILATDLSSRVLELGRQAIYTEAQVEPIALPLRRKYLLRSVQDGHVIRVRKSLRERVSFQQLNFMDPDYGLRHSMDVIFCRNVLIYFDRRHQLEVLLRLARALVPGGFLFLGHSESINGLDVPFDVVAPTVYRRRGRIAGGDRTP